LADNLTLNEGTGGATLSTDDVGGVHVQRVKIQTGADGSATDVSTAAPLPVTASALPLPTGAATAANQTTELAHLAAIETAVEGTLAVSAASLPLPSGAATSAAQATQTAHLAAIETAVEGTLAISAASLPLPSGAATAAKQPALGTAGTPSSDVLTVQGHASGTALKVDGSAVTQPVSAASLPLPSGASTSANQTTAIGHLAAIETAVEGTLTVGTHAVTQSGTWGVRCQDGSGNALTSKVAGSERAMSVAIVDGSGTHITSFGGGTQYTEGDTDASITGTAMLWEDAGNTLRPASAATPFPVAIISGAGSGGTAIQDGAVFTPDTTSLTPIGGYRDDTSPATVTEGDAAACRITTNRALHVNLRDASGNEVSVGGGTQYAEDTASAADEMLTMAGVVRSDTASSKVGTDGDRTVLLVDSSGRLHANVGNTVTVGTHAVTQSGTWTLGANSGVDIGDVTINNASGASAVNIQDGGNSITVDGTVSISGTVTVDTELPAAAALADNTANPTAPAVGAFGLVWDGATWDRMPGTAADGVTVNLAANNDVTVTGSVTANAGTNLNTSALALESGGNLAAAATSLGLLDNAVSGNELQVDIVAALPAGTNNIGDVDVLTLPNVTLASTTNTIEVVGDAAAGAAVSGNPVLVGFRADTTVPTAVDDGDVVHPWTDEYGAQVVKPSCNQIDIQVTPTIDTAVYASGDRLGSVMTFANAALASGRSGTIVSALLFDDANQAFDIRLHLFKVSPTLANADNGALEFTDANLASAIPIGVIEFDNDNAHTYVNNRIVQGTWLGGPVAIPFVTSGSSSIFGVLEARGAYDAAATDDLVVTLTVIRD
jgi:hypothetical protein